MIRSRVVSSFLTILVLSFVYVPVATANPIIIDSDRKVTGFVYTETTGTYPTHQDSTNMPGPFIGAIEEHVIEADASAGYTADQTSSITEFIMTARGVTSGDVQATNGVYAGVNVSSEGVVNFKLDGNYHYEYFGALSNDSLGYGYAETYLYDYTNATITDYITTSSVGFTNSGTLGMGNYSLYYLANSFPSGYGVLEDHASYNVSLILTPLAPTVPDGGNTVVLLLLSSALLAAFAHRQRQRT
jgi:hypothetical protein